MASRIETFQPTVPAGTAIAAPFTTALQFNRAIVQRIEILVPPGPSGLVGFRIQHSGRTVIPYDTSQWIITDDEKIPWEVDNFPTGSAWGFQAYNLDIYDHTIYLRFLVIETTRSSLAIVTPIQVTQAAPAEIEPLVEDVA